jgi:hypothetical protein
MIQPQEKIMLKDEFLETQEAIGTGLRGLWLLLHSSCFYCSESLSGLALSCQNSHGYGWGETFRKSILGVDISPPFHSVWAICAQGDGALRNLAGDIVVDVMIEPTCTHTSTFEYLGEKMAASNRPIKFPIGEPAYRPYVVRKPNVLC